MQQVDDVGIWKVPQEPPSEEPMRDVDEGTPSPDSPEKVDGPAVLSPEGGSGAEWAPASPHRALSTDAEEDLVNGEGQDGRLSGNGCSPEEAEAEAAPVAGEKGDHQPHVGGSEAASTTSPIGQSPGPGKAPASRQRKLAMEEMVIRDHLGQEVGCMDAVGQIQSPLEELGGHRGLEARRDSWGQPGPMVGDSGPNEAFGEGALGSRDGPEGESPTSQGHRSPSGVSQDENGCVGGPGDGPLQEGSLDKEASGSGGGQKAVPEEGALEAEATLALAAGDAPETESTKESQGSPGETPESLEVAATEDRPGPIPPEFQLEQPPEPLPHQCPPEQERHGLSSREEAQIPLLDPALPSSPAQVPVLPQGAAPSLPAPEESLLDQVPPQENQGSPLGPPHQSPAAALEQNSSSPGSKGSLLDPAPSAVQEGLSGEDPPALREPLSSSLEGRPPDVQGEPPLLLPDVVHSAADQVTSSLPEAEGALKVSWSPAPPGTQTAPLPDQPVPPLPEGGPAALLCSPSSGQGMEKPAPLQGPEEEAPLPHTLPPVPEQLPPLPEQRASLLGAEMPALEESTQDRMPAPQELPVSPLPVAEASLPSQAPPPVTAPGESPAAVQDQLPPQDTESSSPAGENPPPSLQEADGALPEEIQAPPPSHASPPPPEEEGLPLDQGPAAAEDQAAAPLLGQTPPCQEAAKSLSEGQSSSDAPEESASVAAHASSPSKAPGPVLQDPPGCPNTLPPSPEAPQPLLPKSKAVGDPDAEGSGDASVASAGGATEALGNLHAERQPLLQEAQGPGDASAGDPPPKTGILKPPAAPSDPTPNDSGTQSSANTASAPQPEAALPRQGPDPEPEKAKRKSCQCCALM